MVNKMIGEGAEKLLLRLGICVEFAFKWFSTLLLKKLAGYQKGNHNHYLYHHFWRVVRIKISNDENFTKIKFREKKNYRTNKKYEKTQNQRLEC